MDLKKGRNKADDISESDLEESLQCIADYFDEDWLNENKEHPLQILWKRRDFLATNELYTFGSSLISVKDIDDGWINDNIKKIKLGDRNHIIGFVFEIISGAMLNEGENQILRLPPSGNPGYDLIAEFNDNSIINISCKNHGLSNHHITFNKKSKDIENLFIELCHKYGKNKIQCAIVNIDNYAEDYDWKNLNNQLEFAIKKFDNEELHCMISDKWLVNLYPLIDSRKISDDYFTYTFAIFSSFHKFEESNLYLKFEDACYNLDKHSKTQSEDEINIIFIHLPSNVSLNTYKDWANQYLIEHEDDKLIAGIFFIQNMVATDVKNETSSISIMMDVANNQHYSTWINKNPKNRLMNLKAVLGQIQSSPPQYKIYIGGKEVDTGDLDLDKCYNYQNGDIFIESEDGVEIRLGSLGYGIKNHLIVRDDNGKAIINPINPPNDKLILI